MVEWDTCRLFPTCSMSTMLTDYEIHALQEKGVDTLEKLDEVRRKIQERIADVRSCVCTPPGLRANEKDDFIKESALSGYGITPRWVQKVEALFRRFSTPETQGDGR